jgi:hypothetical protein
MDCYDDFVNEGILPPCITLTQVGAGWVVFVQKDKTTIGMDLFEDFYFPQSLVNKSKDVSGYEKSYADKLSAEIDIRLILRHSFVLN